MSKLEKIQRLCLRRGIIFPSAEIHHAYSGFYEYGPIGTNIKTRIIELWRDYFIRPYSFMFEMEGSLILPKKVFEASGHLKNFVDPIVQCKQCKKIYRADHLIENLTGKFVEGKSTTELEKLIKKYKLKCPSCGGELSEVKLFNLMLSTNVGPLGDQPAFLRPETAQNIFLGFKRIYQSLKIGLPLGIAQIGKSFRNEISPRKFLIRMREFTQAEIELFFDPENPSCEFFSEISKVEIPIVTRNMQKEKNVEPLNIKVADAVEEGILPNEWMGFFLAKEFLFMKELGVPPENMRFRHMLPEETPHYSRGNFDMEIKFEFGWKEVIGNAYRQAYDLTKHSKASGKDLSIEFSGRKFIPHVVEPSFGIERILLAILCNSFVEKGEDRDWEWLKLPNKIAPFDFAVYPLVKKDGIDKKAKEIFLKLKARYPYILYEEKGSIGKRYARADEIGIPTCITVDYQTLKDNTVTLRERDTRKQKRISLDKLFRFH